MKAALKPLSISVKCFYQRHPLPDPRTVKQGVHSILSREGKHPGGQLTVCFVDDQLMRDLNRRYLDIDDSTDVLSFNYGAKAWAADIVVCVDEALRNCREYKTTLESELFLCVAHGLLHLAGYDDQSERQQTVMRQKERSYLACFKLSGTPQIRA